MIQLQMGKRRRSTHKRAYRGGGVLDDIGSAVSGAFNNVKGAVMGEKAPEQPQTIGETVAPVGTSDALTGADKVAATLPPLANSGASDALGVPADTKYTSGGGRRRRSRKTKRRSRRRGGKY